MDKLFDFFSRHGLGRLVNRETLSYLFWGVVTTLLNIGLFQLLLFFGLDYRIANVITLVVVKIAAYLCNKIFVFRSRCGSFGALLLEILRYILARGFTMLVDYFGLILLVGVLGLRPEIIGKIITTLVVVILNYFLGKFGVFRDKRLENGPPESAAPEDTHKEEQQP